VREVAPTLNRAYAMCSVFVLKFKPTHALRAQDVHRVYPINGSFAITMAQTPRTTSDDPPSIGASVTPQARSGKKMAKSRNLG
jgi:hypothetical protein